MRRILTFLTALALVACGCSPKLAPVKDTETAVTVTERETLRDTVVYLQPDSTLVRALIECNEERQAILKSTSEVRSSDRARTSVSMDNGVLNIRTDIDSTAIYLALKDRYRETATTERTTIRVPVKVNELKWYQEGLMKVGIAALVLLVLAILWKAIKLFLKIR